MSAVEIVNHLHAAALLDLTAAPVVVRSVGFVESSLDRGSIGEYSISFLQALPDDRGGVLITNLNGQARTLGARLFGATSNMVIDQFNAAGARSDGGRVYVQVFRFPTS